MTPDSGTTYMTMPSWARAIFIKQTFQDIIPCKPDLAIFGTLSFVIDRLEYAIPSEYWVSRTIDNKSRAGGTCKNVFRAQDVKVTDNENLFAIGDSFMSVWYTVFDRGQDRIGFAKARHQSEEALIQYKPSGEFDRVVWP